MSQANSLKRYRFHCSPIYKLSGEVRHLCFWCSVRKISTWKNESFTFYHTVHTLRESRVFTCLEINSSSDEARPSVGGSLVYRSSLCMDQMLKMFVLQPISLTVFFKFVAICSPSFFSLSVLLLEHQPILCIRKACPTFLNNQHSFQ